MLKQLFLVLALANNLVNSEINWSEIDSLAEEFLRINETPGLALALINSSSGIWGETFTKGYGKCDQEASVPMQNDTRFLIASISKSFTAITACRVLNEKFPELGESVLDIPIVQLVPTFNLTLIDRYRTEKATFRDLFGHRMCTNSYGIGVTAGAYKSRADRLYRYRYIDEKCGFRTRFEYSNPMFILAGEIIAHITGVPFEIQVTNFLKVLGMTDSLIVTEDENYETLEKMSRGYYKYLSGQLSKMNASVYNSHSGAAAGGIISTATDMAKYTLFHLNTGSVDGKQIVSQEIMGWPYETSNHLKFTGQKPNSFSEEIVEGFNGYGLALEIGLFDGWTRISHDGDLSPFTSRITFYPEMGIGIFSAINGPGFLPGESNHLNLHNFITASLLSLNASRINPKKNVNRFYNKKIIGENLPIVPTAKIDPALLVGVYGHPYEADVNISYNGETLRLEYGIWGKGVLKETNLDNQYSIQWEGDIVSIFLAYNGGPPLPEIMWDFNKPEVLTYIDGDDDRIEYKRDATVDTYPEIPWEDGSCRI